MKNVFAELRRRNIFRVAGMYAVVGWILMQVVSVMTPALNLPDWVDTLIAVLLLIGFPIALLLAWAFELTPDGMKPTKSVSAEESIRSQTGRKIDLAILASLILVGVLLIGNRFLPNNTAVTSGEAVELSAVSATETQAKAIEQGTSIAVLSFADMSSTGDQEYFSDGIAEEILNALVKVPELRVAGRTSSFSFKGKDSTIQGIGQALNVSHVLEGSVRKQNNNVRITAQLIRADDGFHLWSDTYNGTLDNIFDLQDSVSRAIVSQLKIKLNIAGDARLVEGLTTNLEAYDLYLRARELLRTLFGDDVISSAIKLLEQAVVLDPQFSQAWADLAFAKQVLPAYVTVDNNNRYFDAAEKAAYTALAIDPANIKAKSSLVSIRLKRGDIVGGMDQLYKLEAEYPEQAELVWAKGLYKMWYLGQTKASIPFVEKYLETNPLQPDALYQFGTLKYRVGKFVQARELAQKSANAGFGAIAGILRAEIFLAQGNSRAAVDTFMAGYGEFDGLAPSSFRSKEMYELFADAMYGTDTSARNQLANMLKTFFANPETRISSSLISVIINLGEAETLFKVFNRNTIGLNGGALDNLWDPYQQGPKVVRQHPQFPQFVERIGLLDAWQEHGWPDLCRPNADTDGSNGQFRCD